jgi:hypothetical protein
MSSGDFIESFRALIRTMALSEKNRQTIERWYVMPMARDILWNRRLRVMYYTLVTFAVFASIALVGIIPLKDRLGDANWVFWTTWSLSMMMVIVNKFIYVFNIPKKFALNEHMMQSLYAEGKSFVGGYNKYEGIDNLDERVTLFMIRYDRIRSKALQDPSGMDNIGAIASGSDSAKRDSATTGTTTGTPIELESIVTSDETDDRSSADS